MGVYRNMEGYRDPTVGSAFRSIRDDERMEKIGALVSVMRRIAELAGFEVVGRITLLDKKTGRKYK